MVTANYKQVACYLPPAQHAALRRLVAATRVPMSEYLREAVADVLVKHRGAAKKAGRAGR